MSRSYKLIAYTLFALFFPFWIFFSNWNEKSPGPVAISLDSNNLKQIERIAVVLNQKPETYTNDNEHAGVLKTLAATDAEREDNISKLIELLGKQRVGNPNPAIIDVRFTPPIINVNLPTTSISSPVIPESVRKKLNTDSIELILADAKNRFKMLQLQNNSDTAITDIIYLNANEYSVIRYINLGRLCCQDKIEALDYIVTTLLKSDAVLRAELNINTSKISKEHSKTLKRLLGAVSEDLVIYQKELNNNLYGNQLNNHWCKRKLFFGLKNTTTSNITIADTALTDFKFAGINAINSIGVSKQNKLLKIGEVAYYEIPDACAEKVGGKLFYLPVIFTKKPGFLKRPISDTLYLNIKLIR